MFRWETRRPSKADDTGNIKRGGQPKRTTGYADRNREGGGQIKTAFAGALQRAGLADRGITPHDLRHSWASWHYALYRDPIRLQEEGGWSSLDLVRRYTHLLPDGHQAAIRAFWGLGMVTSAEENRATA